jgi:7-cyano-7-deazaguanine synthase
MSGKKTDLSKKAIVVHSGGMDSSICLALAIKEHGAENVLALSFTYGQRHSNELNEARFICDQWKVDRTVIDLNCLGQITSNALMDKTQKIEHKKNEAPNTLVVGRNGLMARVAAIHANSIGAKCIYMGVIEVEEANSGYRDCSRHYMDIIEKALRLDFDDDSFSIKTPIVYMTKKETMGLAKELGVLEFLLENTITCYEGIPKFGCGKCPACLLRNEGIKSYLATEPSIEFSYKDQVLNSNN